MPRVAHRPVRARRAKSTVARDAARWAACLAEAVEHFGQPDGLVRLARAVGRAIPCDAMSVILFDRADRPDLLAVDYPNPIPVVNEAYVRADYLLDPFYHAFLDGRDDGLWLTEDITARDFKASPFYRAYYRQLNQSDEACYVVRTGPGRALCLSFARTRAMGRYRRRERRVMADMAPLVIALARGMTGPSHEATGDATGTTLDGALAVFAMDSLTPRERDVVRTLIKGHASKSAARALGISPETVRNHMKSIRAKLGVTSQAELFARFIACIVEDAGVGGTRP